MTTSEIITEIYNSGKYQKYCRKVCPEFAEDIFQDFIVKLITNNLVRDLYNKPWFSFFCFRIIANINRDRIRESGPVFYGEVPDSADTEIDQTIDCLYAELANMTQYDRDIFLKSLDRKQRELSRKTGITRVEIVRVVKKVRRKLKQSTCIQCSSI